MLFAKSFISCQILLFMCFWPGLRKKNSECPGKEPFFVFYMSTSSLVLSSNQVRRSVGKTLGEISGLGESYFPGPDPSPDSVAHLSIRSILDSESAYALYFPPSIKTHSQERLWGIHFSSTINYHYLRYINEYYNRGVNLEVKGINL